MNVIRVLFFIVIVVFGLSLEAATNGVSGEDERNPSETRWRRSDEEEDHGECGENLTWVFSNGTLTIEGTGTMTDYEYMDPAPWVWFDIESVVIKKGVTSIGDYAFSESYLTQVTIPDSVTSIGNCAFCVCSELLQVAIPDSVTSIGDYAFYFCSELNQVTISDSVTSIGNYAFSDSQLTQLIIPASVTSIGKRVFENCFGLKTITIPENLTSIGEGAFGSCSGLTSIIVDEKNKKYKSINGMLFNYDSDTLVQYPAGLPNTAFIIPDHVTSIGNGAFVGSTLTNITIPTSVKSVGDYAFDYCSSLLYINIPDSITSIGEGAFGHCSSLKDVIIPNSVKAVESGTFIACESLASVSIPESVCLIGEYAFSYCKSLTLITIPEKVTSIESGVFSYCTSLNAFTVPNSVLSIGDDAFYENTNLKSVIIPNSVTTIGNRAFYRCNSLNDITIPNSIRSIGNYAFSSCDNLINVTIPDSVTSIGDGAFFQCAQLTTVTIPDSVESFGFSLFGSCKSLDTVFYQGSVYLQKSIFVSCPNLKNLCVSPDYGFTAFGGVNVTSSTDICQEFQESFNQCYKASFINGTLVEHEKKKSAIEWEKRTNKCMEYQCINDSGLVAWSRCNSTGEKMQFCINSQCVENKESVDKVCVEIEIEAVKVTDLKTEEILETIRIQFGLDSDVIIGYENDEHGIVLRVFVYVSDERIARVIVDSLKEIKKGDPCKYGTVLCRAKNVRFEERSISGAGSLKLTMMSFILPLMYAYVCVFIETIATLV